MLTAIHPKLPMRDRNLTHNFYTRQLGFKDFGNKEYEDYLMLERDQVQIHFFLFRALDPKENYGQVYIRTTDIEAFYWSLLKNQTRIHPNGPLETKEWGLKEFSILDPDHNLLTFGQNL